MSQSRPRTRDTPALTRDQLLIAGGMMAAIALSALDATVVGTALPTIAGQLGGLPLLGWVFSAYLLTSTVTVPFAAKLADMLGRKPVFMAGLAIFVGASVACGLAPSMSILILFRAIQGIGAGAVTTVAFTIIGDAFEPRQRARIQALFGAVWAASSILGPALGGLITSTVGWPWVFELNLPVGLVAGVVVWRVLRERVERRERRLDWTGGILLTVAVVCLLLAVSQAPLTFGWLSGPTLGLAAAAVVLLVAFVRVERRVAEPIVDLAHLRHRVIRPGLLVQALGGFVLFGMTSFVPLMVQGVHGRSAFEAGMVVGTLTIGWPVGSFIGGRALIRWGARVVVLAGAALSMVGTGILTQLEGFGSWWLAALGPVVTGLGIGLMSVVVMVTVQSAVSWEQRGVVTGLTQFSRTIAGTVGVGVMGGILAAFVGSASSAILDPAARAGLSPDQLAADRAALAAGLTWIYWTIFLVCDGDARGRGPHDARRPPGPGPRGGGQVRDGRRPRSSPDRAQVEPRSSPGRADAATWSPSAAGLGRPARARATRTRAPAHARTCQMHARRALGVGAAAGRVWLLHKRRARLCQTLTSPGAP